MVTSHALRRPLQSRPVADELHPGVVAGVVDDVIGPLCTEFVRGERRDLTRGPRHRRARTGACFRPSNKSPEWFKSKRYTCIRSYRREPARHRRRPSVEHFYRLKRRIRPASAWAWPGQTTADAVRGRRRGGEPAACTCLSAVPAVQRAELAEFRATTAVGWRHAESRCHAAVDDPPVKAAPAPAA